MVDKASAREVSALNIEQWWLRIMIEKSESEREVRKWINPPLLCLWKYDRKIWPPKTWSDGKGKVLGGRNQQVVLFPHCTIRPASGTLSGSMDQGIFCLTKSPPLFTLYWSLRSYLSSANHVQIKYILTRTKTKTVSTAGLRPTTSLSSLPIELY